VPWSLSLLLPISVVWWIISLLVAPAEPDLLVIRVESQVTGARMPDAVIQVGELRYDADEQGEITIHPVDVGTTIAVTAAGHESLRREVPEPGFGTLTLSLSGVLVYGSIVDALTDQPVAGADVSVPGPEGDIIASAHTDDFGSFIFKFIPEDATLVIADDVYGASTHALEGQRSVLIALDPPPVTGRVVDDAGQPLAGVVITHGQASIQADGAGRFTLTEIGQGAEVVLSLDGTSATVNVEGRDLGDIVLQGPAATPDAGDELGR
jgi:hypothetical protein